MKKFKITIYNLILIIVVICIIIVCITFSISNLHKRINIKKFVAEMELVQEKVNQVRKEYLIWENYNPNEVGNFLEYIRNLGYLNATSASNIYISEFNEIIQKLNNKDTKYWDMNVDSILSNYCYFNSENLKQYFNIDTNLNVIINFYSGNIIDKTGVKDISNKNNIIYRQYDTKFGNSLNITDFKDNLETIAEVIENNGLSQRIKVSFNNDKAPKILEVYYYIDENENKKLCSDFQDYIYISEENSIYFTVNASGDYKFIIKDTNYKEYKAAELSINLCNKPILLENMQGIYWNNEGEEILIENESDHSWYDYSIKNLKMANAKTQDGNYWVWVPRFMYNIVDDITKVEYIYETTNRTTNNKVLSGYKLQESFSENDDISGFWISKFQVNENYNEKVSINPGKTLIITSALKARQISENYIVKFLKENGSILSEENKMAVLLISQASKINISNDLVHYAGGGVNEKDYITNTRYSSTGNIYGVYDLITSENELVQTSNANEIGRFRMVLKK